MKFYAGLILAMALSAARADLVNGINAIVDDSIITYQQVEASLEPYRDLLRVQFANQPQVADQKLRQARADAMEDLVKQQLILHDFEKTAKEHNFKFPESVVEDAVRDKIKQIYGDRVTLTKTLQAQGRSYESFRQQIKEQFLVQVLTYQKVSAEKIIVSPNKLQTFYREHQNDFKMEDQVKLRMITLNKSTDKSPESVRKLADEILKKIEAGTSFAEMASVYSEGTQRAQGGDRGWVDRTYFKKEITDTAFALKAGEHSRVLDLPEACYILQVDETKLAHVRPLSEVKEEVEKTLRAQEKARLEKKWIERIRAKSYVRYY